MHAYSLSHLSDPTLLRDLAALVVRDRATTASLLAHIAEVDARRLYLPAAYPSMFGYCVHELHLSEDAAYKRIQAARVARLEAAAHKTRAEIEQLLAERFPRPDLPARVEAVSSQPAPTSFTAQLALERVAQLAPERVEPPGRKSAAASAPASRVASLAPGRYALQLTIGQEIYDDLRHAQALLGHRVPSGDVAQVLGRALKALIGQLEKTKFAATTRPRRSASQRPSTNPRHIPAHVQRAVWERDGGQCTFVSEAGRRCAARKPLEFDHVEEVARGGRATTAGIRLRCRAHNQYAAECTFGAEFMRRKRDEVRRAAENRRRVEAEARVADEVHRKAAKARAQAAAEEVITPLRLLGFRADEARRAAALCEAIPDASLEARMRRALSCFGQRPRTPTPAPTGPGSAP